MIHRKSQERRIVKILPKSSLTPEHFVNELQLLRQLDHPNIIRLYEYYQDDSHYYLILELCSGGELCEEVITNITITEEKAGVYIRDILSIVLYLHTKHIVHRDIKLANFLLCRTKSRIVLKLIDFSLARFLPPTRTLSELAGSIYYRSPEMLSGAYSHSTDIWSTGILLYIMLGGYPPFIGSFEDETNTAILRGVFSFHSSEWEQISPRAKDFLSSLLTQDALARPSAEELLNSPWMMTVENEEISPSTAAK